MNVAETCFHHFEENISSDVLPERFTYPFCYKPHPLVEEAARIVVRDLSSFPAWKEEVGRGKMFGVLVVADGKGGIGFIAAYSGNIAHNTDYSYFVPPVYDVLSPDGFFRKEELEISRINEKISELELSESFRLARERLESVRKEAACEISSYAEMMKEAKKRRDAARESGIDDAARERLLSESQYQKAELKRMKRRWDAIVGDAEADVAVFTRQIDALRRERKERSVALQRRVFEKFDFLNARGEVRNVCDIFEEARHELPPAGAGECAAPRLLQFAYVHGYRPLAMGEFWLGESPEGEIRKHGQFYPSCKSKCEPILKFMLQGLEVEASPLEAAHCGEQDLSTVYEDDAIWVVDKPAGMLSVPGKTRQDSVSDIACRKFSPEARPLVVHRLDMHTSGLLVVAKTIDVYRALQKAFAERKVEKRYVAVLDGEVEKDEGEIRLPLRLDLDRRPMQVVDYVHGKEAVTRYRVLARSSGATRVEFAPLTGRTHQLRVHAAHQSGLNAPIKGDMLYGNFSDRLYLHASFLKFNHPVDNKEIILESIPNF